MAEAVVSFVAEKLYNLLKEEAIFLDGVDDQVNFLERELRQMQAFLRVADSMAIRNDNISNYLKNVRDAAYDAEDIVDSCILRMHRRRRREGRSFRGFIKKYGCILHECRQRHNIGMQIEKVKTRLQTLSEMRSTYGIPDLTSGAQGTVSEFDITVQSQRALPIRREMNVTVGFQDVMERIVGSLLNISEKPRRCVVSIVGMGGAGKSTLARRVCNREDVLRSFNGCALVTISQTVNLRKILEDIAVKFSNIDRKTLQQMEEVELQDKVLTSLQGKRYLIVLDDIWETDVWPLICPHFPDDKNGSRVIITTRSMDVAQLADPSMEPHQLRRLSEKESWELFTKIVFPDGHDDGDAEQAFGSEELKMVGKKILKNCGGLPLAIIVMGGMLSIKEKSPNAWEDAAKEMRWEDVPRGRAFSEVVVGLSYRDLPHHLKPCFLYLGHFPEDFKIYADELIRLWIAEGFVPDRMDGKTMEETAGGWLEDLVRRCLVQAVYRDYSGMLETCQMHDVVRDLSKQEAEKVNFFHTWEEQQVASGSSPWSQTRRLALHRNSRYTFQQFFVAPKLRTLVAVDIEEEEEEEGMSRWLPTFIMGLKLLRVLNLRGSKCRELPRETGDLIHLRYLGLSLCKKLESIPSSIGNLRNLQTFDVSETYSLTSVPDSVWGIGTLRHVLLGISTENEIEVLRHVLVDIGIENEIEVLRYVLHGIRIGISSSLQALVNLQTLEGAPAGSWMGSSLATLTTLRSLKIYRISEAHHRVLSDSLDSLLHLRRLSLHGDSLPKKALALPNHLRLQHLELYGRLKLLVDDDNSSNHPAAYGSDEMPPNLNDLVLYNSGLQQDPFLLLEKLPYLRRLLLLFDGFGGNGGAEAVRCSAGGFPQLEELQLFHVSCLRWWTVESGALPRLRCLVICDCPQLKMLPNGLQHLKTLQMLNIYNMPSEFVRRLCEDEGGQDWHKIEHIPHLKFG